MNGSGIEYSGILGKVTGVPLFQNFPIGGFVPKFKQALDDLVQGGCLIVKDDFFYTPKYQP